MTEMTQDKAERILKGRKIFNKPSKKTVKVTSVHEHEGNHIVNFSAMTYDQAVAAREEFVQGNFDESCKSNLSTTVFAGNQLPMKGEFVNILVDLVKSRSGEMILGVKSWSEIPVDNEVVSFDFTASAQAKEALVASESEFEREIN